MKIRGCPPSELCMTAARYNLTLRTCRSPRNIPMEVSLVSRECSETLEKEILSLDKRDGIKAIL